MFKPYDKNGDISYSLGAFPTVELIKRRPSDVVAVALHSKFKMTDEVAGFLSTLGDKVFTSDKDVERIAKKGNTFMVGAFKKRFVTFGKETHVCLVNPSDAGNLGTIMRTAVGFGIKNLAIVGTATDVYDPKVVRASMGAIFSENITVFSSWDEYEKTHSEDKYLFMLDKRSTTLGDVRAVRPCAFVFGNEGSGLPRELAERGTSVIIRHTTDIDSLNLPQAVAIGLYEMTKEKFCR